MATSALTGILTLSLPAALYYGRKKVSAQLSSLQLDLHATSLELVALRFALDACDAKLLQETQLTASQKDQLDRASRERDELGAQLHKAQEEHTAALEAEAKLKLHLKKVEDHVSESSSAESQFQKRIEKLLSKRSEEKSARDAQIAQLQQDNDRLNDLLAAERNQTSSLRDQLTASQAEQEKLRTQHHQGLAAQARKHALALTKQEEQLLKKQRLLSDRVLECQTEAAFAQQQHHEAEAAADDLQRRLNGLANLRAHQVRDLLAAHRLEVRTLHTQHAQSMSVLVSGCQREMCGLMRACVKDLQRLSAGLARGSVEERGVVGRIAEWEVEIERVEGEIERVEGEMGEGEGRVGRVDREG